MSADHKKVFQGFFAALSAMLLLTSCMDDTPPAEVEMNVAKNPYHIVRKGETLSSIASKYGISRTKLIELNKLKSPYKLFIGQKLIVRTEKGKATAKNINPVPNVADTGEVEVQVLGDTQPQTDANGNPVTPVPTIGSGVAGASNFMGNSGTLGTTESSGVAPTAEGAASEVITPQHGAVAPMSAGKMSWPVRGEIVKSFGSTVGGQKNDGINISAPAGTPVVAADNGVVLFSGNQAKGYGNLVIIRHANNKVTVYGHLKDTAVKANQQISAGQQIGSVGTSGGIPENQPQLHFEVREGKTPQNPTKYLN